MAHDDGKKVDDINNADVVLLGVAEPVKHLLQYILQTEVIKLLMSLSVRSKNS